MERATLHESWHHSPTHLFQPGLMYMITAGTLQKAPYFSDGGRLGIIQSELFQTAKDYGWNLEAWAIFPNHYHFVAQAPSQGKHLREFVRSLHSASARKLNRIDGTVGRRVWFQFWDTCLTYEASYFARLKYVHTNPVHHGITRRATQYPFCSASWFVAKADRALYKRVLSYACDKINVCDDF